MQKQYTTNRLGLALSTIGMALLTACGGGGSGSGVGETPEIVMVQPPAEPAAVTSICGASTLPQEGLEMHQTSHDETAIINGVTTPASIVTSAAGYPYDGAPITLTLSMDDLRGVMFEGYTPGTTGNSMSVETPSRLAAGSVGCLVGVSRLINNGTEALPTYLLSWTSSKISDLPVGLVPDEIVNGFEFMHNFSSTAAKAVFRMSKTSLADPSAARICHVASTTSVSCSAPTVSESTDSWTFTQPISAPGVYLLSAPR